MFIVWFVVLIFNRWLYRILVCATPNCVFAAVDNNFSGFGATSGAGSGNNNPSFEPNDGIIDVDICKSALLCGPGCALGFPSVDRFALLPIGGRSWYRCGINEPGIICFGMSNCVICTKIIKERGMNINCITKTTTNSVMITSKTILWYCWNLIQCNVFGSMRWFLSGLLTSVRLWPRRISVAYKWHYIWSMR